MIVNPECCKCTLNVFKDHFPLIPSSTNNVSISLLDHVSAMLSLAFEMDSFCQIANDSPHSFSNQSYMCKSRKAPGSSVLCDEYLKEMSPEHPLWYFRIMWSISLVPIILSVVLACWSLLCKALVPLIMICLEEPVAPQCMTNALTKYKPIRPFFFFSFFFFLFPSIKYSTVALAYAVSEYLLNAIVREEKRFTV